MKKIILQLLPVFFALPILSFAQSGFQKGSIVTAGNEQKEGLIKQSLHSNGKITFLSPDGNQKTYTASDINGFSLEGATYISWLNDFYKEIASGTITLYQKVTDNRNVVLYSGPDPIGFMKTSEGNRNDYYVRMNTEVNLTLITRKEFKKFVTRLFENSTVQKEYSNKPLSYSDIVNVVELYNSGSKRN